MSPRAPATTNISLLDVETPALIVDLDFFEQNLVRLQAAADTAGIRLRPHGKAHKTPEIARRQMALGAVGICCQKLAEAEAFADAGIPDILITNQIADPGKIARLPALSRKVTLGICIDDVVQLARLAAAFAKAEAQIDVYVEIDIGMQRCGVRDGERLVALAAAADAAPGLRFAGLQAYQGMAQHLRSVAERTDAIEAASALIRKAKRSLAEAGIDCPRITGSGTGTYALEAAAGILDEIQAGSYALMDADYARNSPGPEGHFAPALAILTTVISTAVPGRAVLDLGLKGVTCEMGLPVVQLDGSEVLGVSDEHCIVTQPAGAPLATGDRVSVIPGHVDPACNLHDWMVAVRNGKVEELWPITARGPGL